MLYTLNQFAALPTEQQLSYLHADGVALDLAHETKSAEAVLFSYAEFYVEVVIDRRYDEVLQVRCFRNTRKLTPYLPQVDISGLLGLLSCP